MSTEKVEKIKALSVRALVISVVYMVSLMWLLTFWQLVFYRSPDPMGLGALPRGNVIFFSDNYWAEVMNPYIPTLFWFLFPLLINMVLPKKIKLNAAELSLLWVMMAVVPNITSRWCGLMWNNIAGVWQTAMSPATGFWGRGYFESAIFAFSPRAQSVFALEGLVKNPDLVKALYMYGGIPVPWDVYAPEIIWTSINLISFWMMWLIWYAILRRQMVEVEALPFPMAAAIYETMMATQADEEGKIPLFRNKMLLIGILLGFLYLLAQNLNRLGVIPSALKLYIDLTSYNVTSVLLFNFALFIFAFAIFQTQATLMTTVIGQVVLYMLMPPIWAAAGVIPYFVSTAATLKPDAWWLHDRVMSIAANIPQRVVGGMYHNFMWGFVASMAIVPIILHRTHFVETIKAAIKGTRSPEEAFSYRTLWLGFVVSLAVYMSTVLYCDMGIQWLLFYLAIAFTWMTGLMRIEAECGLILGGVQMTECYGMWLPSFIMFGHETNGLGIRFQTTVPHVLGGTIVSPTYDGAWLEFLIHWQLRNINCGAMGSFSHMSIADGWSLSQRTKSHPRDLFLGTS